MGDDKGKGAEEIGLEAVDDGSTDVPLTQPSSVDQSSPAGIVGSPSKVPNGSGQLLNVGEVVLSIDGDNSESSGVSTEGNGKTEKPLSGLNVINGAVISFHNVSYSVDIRPRCCSCRKESQPILKNAR
jgi:hypothetical protein